MNAKGRIISTLLVIDTFFVSYAAGFNSRHVLIIDPKMPDYVAPVKPTAPITPKVNADKHAATDAKSPPGSTEIKKTVPAAKSAGSHNGKTSSKSGDKPSSGKIAGKSGSSNHAATDHAAKPERSTAPAPSE